ncbi:hypothetical protein D9M72_622640 [compost metagenome]
MASCLPKPKEGKAPSGKLPPMAAVTVPSASTARLVILVYSFSMAWPRDSRTISAGAAFTVLDP